MREMGGPRPRIPLRAWAHRTPGHGLFPYEDARQKRWRRRSGFWEFSTPLAPHLHIPESVQFQGRVGTPCVPTSEPPPGERRNAPNPHHHTSFARLTQAPSAAKRASRPAPNHPYLGTSRTSTPGSDRPMVATNRTVPSPRFHPHQGTPPQLPTQPRQAHSLGQTLPVADASPDGRTAHSTAVAVVSSTPHPASTDLQPHPSTRQTRIQGCQPLVREDIPSSNDVHNLNEEAVNTMK